jgi:GGDEF domain-containing protein
LKESEASALPWISGEFDISALIRTETHVLDSAQIRDDITREIERAARCFTPRFIVILIDIPKSGTIVSDSGGKAWDQALKAIANRLGPLLSPRDSVATLDGGRLVILADTKGHYGKPDEFAQDLQLELSSGITIGDELVVFPSSVGIAWITSTSSSAEMILANAAIALGRARAEGPGNAVIFHDWMRELEIISSETVSEQVQS